MQTRFEVQLTKEDYVVGLDALFGELAKVDPTRNRVIFQRLAVVVLLMLATGWFFPEAMIGIFFIIVGFAILEGLLARFWTKSAHGTSFDPAVGTQFLEFTDGTITDSSAMRKREWRWDAVRRVHEREAGLVFELVGWDMLVLPTRLWESAGDRQRFVDDIRGFISRPVGEPISSTPSPAPAKVDMFNLAAIGAFVDVCLIVMSVVQLYPEGPVALGKKLGPSVAVALITLLSAVLGYVAYRGTKAGLPRLNARSPATAIALAHTLIWAFAAWFGATALGWI